MRYIATISLMLASVLFATGINPPATTDIDFHTQLAKSGYVHSILPLDKNNSLDSRFLAKKVSEEVTLKSLLPSCEWKMNGDGDIEFSSFSKSGEGSVAIHFSTVPENRAKGSSDDPDYAVYGYRSLSCILDGVNLEPFNRIAFSIYPVYKGRNVVNLNFRFSNSRQSSHKPGHNYPTGDHLINLDNGCWNECTLEIDDFDRDKVESLTFSATLNGRDLFTGDSCSFYIDNVRFQKVEKPEKISGWIPDKDRISYSMTGYDTYGKKTALVSPEYTGQKFEIISSSTGNTLFDGNVNKVSTSIGTIGVIDFSDFSMPGNYYLRCDSLSSHIFCIGGNEIWDNSLWKVTNFVYGMRCGDFISGVHSSCHSDLFAVHNGVKIPYNGGWHDAGDLSQQTLQTGDLAYSFLIASESIKTRNPILGARLREEARHGLEFLLRTRFGDGYRASSMGLLLWLDGYHDSFDDINTVRVQNVSYDNFLYAAYEAYAAKILTDDKAFSDALLKASEEDFGFAMKEFEKNGYGGYISPYEHTFNTSRSQYNATVSWAAALLYELTDLPYYYDVAKKSIEYVLECQQTDPVNDNGLCGFFYRDTDKKSIVHYIHQSREQLYATALDAMCRAFPDCPDCSRWMESMRLYGNYIKSLMSATAPYGMIPSGLYLDDEYLDEDNFYSLHIFAPTNASLLYTEQLKGGIKVGPHHYIKRFPIWFNIFNGNLAVHMSVGHAAAICARRLSDSDLREIAREQLFWVVGKNPFAQSLIYGEGHDYPMINNFSSGELTGGMPVGIRTLNNTDQPYWPQINNACYKEAWVTSAGKWISLVASLEDMKSDNDHILVNNFLP